eukprot:gb/GECH01011283.1/.p1 GENE.gb/GECH01011283.1/~~gb/GECH01011283.1/.p1  ORF type:complete len:609 (+),score=103.29 gb/GECH01011283.1/:1-1827(+)
MNRLFGTLCLSLVAVLVLISSVNADLYIHNMRGSNNRFNEPNANRQNANRLFDSQNNGKGGYPIGEQNPTDDNFAIQPIYYFAGSYLRLEWTQQHACGFNNKTFCQLVLQYTCTDGSSKTYNGQPWTPTDGEETGDDANPPTTGYIEPMPMYEKCTKRQRNMGLYNADRDLDGDAAIYTRQNNNGDQYGTECPEERDYYPYWHPTPFKDIAVFTNSPDTCPFYQSESQNVKPKGECECPAWNTDGCPNDTPCWTHNNPSSCQATDGCVWAEKTHSTMFGGEQGSKEDQLSAPPCSTGGDDYWSRDNHLGNAKNGQTPYYIWKIPDPETACGNPDGCDRCFFRMRYNITTSDYHRLEDWQLPSDLEDTSNLDHYFWVDSRLNGSRSIKMDNSSNYFENDPVVDMGVGRGLALALNTAQTGRTFQDRSHSFMIKKRPEGTENKEIYNINVRGKRGNIVQAYPAVEYDFVPKYLEINEGDLVHFQWVGSNRYPNNYAGQGNQANDRNNVMEFKSLNHNYPKPIKEWSLITDEANIKSIATSGEGDNADTQLNNASPSYDAYEAFGGKFVSPKAGTYYYGSTRNSDFTNRSQKATLFVRGSGNNGDGSEEDK